MLLRKYESIEVTDNGYLIHGDVAAVLLVFMTDDIIRIRVHFDSRTPMKEESYTLVMTAWPDRMDELLKDERTRITPLMVPYTETEKDLTFATKTVKLVLRKEPFSFALYDVQGNPLYRDLKERAFERDQLGRLSHYSCMDRAKDHFFGFGEKTGHLDKKFRRMRMSPKDAIGHDPETGDPMYKHIPFYVRIHEDQTAAVGLFYHNSYDCVFDMGQEVSGYWEPYWLLSDRWRRYRFVPAQRSHGISGHRPLYPVDRPEPPCPPSSPWDIVPPPCIMQNWKRTAIKKFIKLSISTKKSKSLSMTFGWHLGIPVGERTTCASVQLE